MKATKVKALSEQAKQTVGKGMSMMYILQKLTNSTLTYNIKDLLSKIEDTHTPDRINEGIAQLIEDKYIKAQSVGRNIEITILKKVVYPRYMTLGLKTSVEYIIGQAVPIVKEVFSTDRMITHCHYMEISTSQYKSMIKELADKGVKFTSDLFDAVEYDCENINTVVKPKEIEAKAVKKEVKEANDDFVIRTLMDLQIKVDKLIEAQFLIAKHSPSLTEKLSDLYRKDFRDGTRSN